MAGRSHSLNPSGRAASNPHQRAGWQLVEERQQILSGQVNELHLPASEQRIRVMFEVALNDLSACKKAIGRISPAVAPTTAPLLQV